MSKYVDDGNAGVLVVDSFAVHLTIAGAVPARISWLTVTLTHRVPRTDGTYANASIVVLNSHPVPPLEGSRIDLTLNAAVDAPYSPGLQRGIMQFAEGGVRELEAKFGGAYVGGDWRFDIINTGVCFVSCLFELFWFVFKSDWVPLQCALRIPCCLCFWRWRLL